MPKWRVVPRARSCPTEKIRYPTRRIAVAELVRLQQWYTERNAERIPVRVHPCEQCGGWHTTSKEYRPQ
jgi:hypothetical protein